MLSNAFALAHKASQLDQFDLAARNAFRAIAVLIWKSCGRPFPLATDLALIEPIAEGIAAKFVDYPVQVKESGPGGQDGQS